MQFSEESLGNRVLIIPEIEEVSKGGIFLARDQRSQAINTDRGSVYMIGPECWFDLPHPPKIKVGDKVLYSHYGAKHLKANDQHYIICNDTDILVAYTEEVKND